MEKAGKSSKKAGKSSKKLPHQFETDPNARKKIHTKLMKNIERTLEEYSLQSDEQAVVLAVTDRVKRSNKFVVRGSKHLKEVVQTNLDQIGLQLEDELLLGPVTNWPPERIPIPPVEDRGRFVPRSYDIRQELPPFEVEGIPRRLDSFSQKELREFIHLMLKCSTGKNQPGWGDFSVKPKWWPCDVPWKCVSKDMRSDEMKRQISWTDALRGIVINCYTFHEREDLLKATCHNSDPAPDVHVTRTNPESYRSPVGLNITPVGVPGQGVLVQSADGGPIIKVVLQSQEPDLSSAMKTENSLEDPLLEDRLLEDPLSASTTCSISVLNL